LEWGQIKVNKRVIYADKEKRGKSSQQRGKGILIIPGILVMVLAGYFLTQGGGSDAKTTAYAQLEGDLKIVKSEVTVDAKFYPFNLDGANMEVVALKAGDGTIRTALNTCQVCYASGRGYYKQEPNTKELICQNCGNRFALEQVELIKGGCNPVPIMKENKTDDGANITISRSILEENKYLFARWSKS
jgi:hypothetical protein